MRIEPPKSLPSASATMPAATAAALPPEEPPACSRGLHGLRVAPKRVVLGDRPQPELGRVRLADDDRARLPQPAHVRAVVVGDPVAEGGTDPCVVGSPSVGGEQVLDADRHAAQRPRVAGADRSASASARSSQRATIAPSAGFRRSVAASAASTSSRADSSPARTIAA